MADGVTDMVANNSVTKGAGALLGKKYGPLPFGAWLLIAGGTAFLVRRGMNKFTGSEDTNTTSNDPGSVDSGVLTAGSPTGANWAGYAGNNPSAGDPSGSSNLDVSSNALWAQRATSVIVDKGVANGYSAGSAITKYLAGSSLTTQEQAWVSEAIAVLGPPPEAPPTPAPTTTAPVIPKPTVNQRSQRSTLTLVRTSIPAKLGDKMSMSIRWIDSTGIAISGAVEVLMSVNGGGWVSEGTYAVRQGLGVYDRKVGARNLYRFKVQPAPRETRWAQTVSNAVEFNAKNFR